MIPLSKVSKQGLCLFLLGFLKTEGWGGEIEEEDPKALGTSSRLTWMEEKGEDPSQVAKGLYDQAILYERGKEGTEKNREQAISWYEAAAHYGSIDSIKKLEDLLSYEEKDKADKEKAFALFQELAWQGNPVAQLKLGLMIESWNEVGEKGCLDSAFELYQQSAQQGIVDAQLQEARCLFHGIGTPIDKEKAYKIYRELARSGNSKAQYNVGLLREEGLGTQKNFKKAALWYQKASDQGELDAHINLGVLYERGWGVSKDEEKAEKFYTEAAEKGDVIGQSNLGILLAKKNDFQKARFWFGRGAESEDPICLYWVASFLEQGVGGPKKPKKAFELYKKSARLGLDKAQLYLGNFYHEDRTIKWKFYKKNDQKSEMWFRKAADQRNPVACYNLAVLLLKKQPRDKQTYGNVQELLTRASEGGIAEAQYNLGVFFERGLGGEQNFRKAKELYKKAALQGLEKALEAYKELKGYFFEEESQNEIVGDDSSEEETLSNNPF